MKSKIDTLIIKHTKYDRRIKITNEQRDEIRKMYATNKYSYGKLAEKYGVTKMTIKGIVDKEFFERRRKYSQEYSKKYRKQMPKSLVNAYAKNYRDYKRELIKSGDLQKEQDNE